MRKIAFGFSDRCNIKCAHCVASGQSRKSSKMELTRAKEILADMAKAQVGAISFTAGEPFLYFNELTELISLCRELNIYTRIVSNCFWAKTSDQAKEYISTLKQCGLSQLRISSSRWHQQHVPHTNILHAAEACQYISLDYFISFVTDFSQEDDAHEEFLRKNSLKFFPEPLIYSGRAMHFQPKPLFTDYQENRCEMNPYLAPDLNVYACCDAGNHFNTTKVFYLGNLKENSIDQLFYKSENDPLFYCIRNLGISTIASFSGLKARDIVTYRKCELCEKLFNSPESLAKLKKAAQTVLPSWSR